MGVFMARDHRRLRVFHEAHDLALAVYRETRDFPKDEWFGLRAQLRRASVSVASNIVEGSARRGRREYVNFVNIARGSAAEVGYLVALAFELGYLSKASADGLQRRYDSLIPQLESLVKKLELLKHTPASSIGPEHNASRP